MSVCQLSLENLSCQRGDKILFAGLNLCFQSGDFVQIEGHNGIGKTSLLRIIAGVASPLQGKVRWNQIEILKNRESYHQDLLYLGHQSGVKPELTAFENLQFYQKVSDCHQGAEILWDALQRVGLLGREDISASQLSAGQQKRIGLARLWLSKSPLWILDEPFNAIDKQGVQELTQHFERHVEQGGIVLLTSHQDVPSSTLQKVSLEQFKLIEE